MNKNVFFGVCKHDHYVMRILHILDEYDEKGCRRYEREREIEMHCSLTHFKNVV